TENPASISVSAEHMAEVIPDSGKDVSPLNNGALSDSQDASSIPRTEIGQRNAVSSSKDEIKTPKSVPPLSPAALVTEPVAIDGLKSWTVETIGHRGRIYQAEYSPDGQWLATLGADSTIRLWDGATGKLARALVGHSEQDGVLA